MGNIPTHSYQMNPSPLPTPFPTKDYTVDWWSNNIPRWNSLVLPCFKSRSFIRVLELGPHEGITSNWLMDNLDRPHIVCIDAFHAKDPSGALLRRFKHNVREHVSAGNLEAFDGDINGILRKMPSDSTFDLIYVDQLGKSKDVLQAAILCFEHLRPNGMMVFDDYTHDKWHGPNCPRPGIDAFLNTYATYIQVIDLSWQAIVVRREVPLDNNRGQCRSELYPNSSPDDVK
jgi:SAM-dependent methyltransferase